MVRTPVAESRGCRLPAMRSHLWTPTSEPTMPRPPIVLDLDGVILQTNAVKREAMVSLFDVDEDRKTKINDYVRSAGGVRRDLKIMHILRSIQGHPCPEGALPGYLERYAAVLKLSLPAAPLVPGVGQFMRDPSFTFYLSSSAPEAEVMDQLRSRGLLDCFEAVFGASTPKEEALSRVQARSHDRQPVFFGDSLADLDAARAAGTPFVAVVHETDNFPGAAVVKLRDFTSREVVQRCMSEAQRGEDGAQVP